MEFIVYKNDVEITFKAEGSIVPVESNDGNKYVKGLFNKKAQGVISMFQKEIERGDSCILRNETEQFYGKYVSESAVDRSPIISL